MRNKFGDVTVETRKSADGHTVTTTTMADGSSVEVRSDYPQGDWRNGGDGQVFDQHRMACERATLAYFRGRGMAI